MRDRCQRQAYPSPAAGHLEEGDLQMAWIMSTPHPKHQPPSLTPRQRGKQRAIAVLREASSNPDWKERVHSRLHEGDIVGLSLREGRRWVSEDGRWEGECSWRKNMVVEEGHAARWENK